MNLNFLIHQKDGIAIGNATDRCVECLKALFNPSINATFSKKCVNINKFVRLGRVQTGDIIISLCDKDKPKSSRLFKEKITGLKEIYLILKPSIAELCAQKMKDIEQRFEELSHNVVKYNAKGIQAAYLLIPQEKYISSYDKREFIKQRILRNINQAADSFLTLIKNLELTKADILVFDRLHTLAERLTAFMKEHIYPNESVF